MLNSLICLIVTNPIVQKHRGDQIPFMHTYALQTSIAFRIRLYQSGRALANQLGTNTSLTVGLAY